MHMTEARRQGLNNTRLRGLHRVLIRKVRAVLRDLEGHGWKPLIAEGIRTVEQQRAKVRAGVSKTMNSKHLPQRDGYGWAADVIDCRYAWNIKQYPAQVVAFRRDLGSSAEAHNLTWGGRWTKFYGKLGDWAHVELKREDAK